MMLPLHFRVMLLGPMHHFDGVPIQITDDRAKIIRADVRPATRCAHSRAAEPYRGIVECGDFVLVGCRDGNVRARSHDGVVRAHRIEPERPFALRPKRRFGFRAVFEVVAKRKEATG
jgi:hypothetical protein